MKLRARLAALAAGVLVAALALTGCSTTASTTASAGKVPTKTIGVWQSQADGDGEKQTLAGIKKAAEAVGWKLVITDSAGSPQAMGTTMTSLINQRVDAILAVFINTGLIAPQLAQAKAAGIPVISVGFQGTPAKNLTAEYAAPQADLATALLDQMKKDLPDGGTVAPITVTGYYGLDQQLAVLKKDGPGAGFEPLEAVNVPIDNLFAGTTSAGVTVLNANPKLSAIWSMLDVDVQNLVPALQQTGRQVPIYGFGAIPGSLKYVRSGQAKVVTANSNQSGFIAIDSLLAYWIDKTPIPSTTPDKYKFQFEIVTKDNAPADGQEVYPLDETAKPFLADWKKKYGI
ncbi:sugar ABC transporter substrate-binding protein [Pseudolysinimonas sp.]|uniref:sugar ABC transporter substrate-binding protein n=1 Tax=Pseudolysinimonas sp. TaxID=2680009 RepID=UPI003F7D6C09